MAYGSAEDKRSARWLARVLVAMPFGDYLWSMTDVQASEDTLDGMLLIAMPGMPDPRFTRSLIYLCTYTRDGAMGLIVNQVADQVSFDDVIGQLGIDIVEDAKSLPVHVGGPVETSRGFVLHSSDYRHPDTLVIDKQFALSATVDVLKAIAEGGGPKRKVFALGYAGWAPGQLDQEIRSSGWLLAPPDDDLVFGSEHQTKWERALQKIGVDPSLLSGEAGHA